MYLSHSVSDQNVLFTYVCLISGVKPSNNDTLTSRDSGRTFYQTINAGTDEDTEQPIQVERSKALHELVTCRNNNKCISGPSTQNETGSIENLDLNPDVGNSIPNPNILKLTKMKWLTVKHEDTSDSSSPSISSSSSTCSVISRGSQGSLNHYISSGDKCLSTILRLDKEHNMFGLSNIAMDGTKISKKNRKDDEKPVFPQTAIVQVCCGMKCCKHKSNTDLPISLKCNACHGCCYDPYCSTCTRRNCDIPCPPASCSSCARLKCVCKAPCLPPKCTLDCCNGRGGMKIILQRKPTYEPSPMELTPRSSCVLQKPLAARSCHHVPECITPSSCFPYLLPCFWPSRPGAPCNHPSRCFHNPPCRPPRTNKSSIRISEICPQDHKCIEGKNKCPNKECPGGNPSTKQAIESRFGKK